MPDVGNKMGPSFPTIEHGTWDMEKKYKGPMVVGSLG